MLKLLTGMKIEEYATLERAQGEQVIEKGGIYWRRVRPFFYRPLLPYMEYARDAVTAPLSSWFGGVQYAVTPEEAGNSFLNFLIFTQPGSYSLDSLDYNRKRQIKRAASEFIIRPVEDLEEFKTQGYAAYLSFYQRSRYSYGSRRRHQSYFCLWAEDLFEMPKANVLGAYRNGQLRGVSVSFLVEHTLFYATFFCDTPSLKLFLSDLMLHAIREEASHLPGIKQVFAGMYKGGCGLDDFYLLRGCTLIRKPAFLRTNPISTLILRRYLPQQHAKLLGRMGRGDGTLDAPRRPVASPSGNSAQPGQKASDKMAY